MSTKEEKLEHLTSLPLEYLMIKAKDERYRGKEGTRFTFNYAFKDTDEKLPLTDTERLMDKYQDGARNFLSELIDVNLGNNLITEAIEGDARLLPSRYARFYDQCIRIKTKQFTLYVTDLAIQRMRKIILRLYRQSISDALRYGTLLINGHNVGILSIGYHDVVSSIKGHTIGVREPFQTTYHNVGPATLEYAIYGTNLKLDNENASKLIDTFGDTYGPFNWYTLEKKWIEAGNEYGKKIVLDGVSEENPLYQKVLSLGRGK